MPEFEPAGISSHVGFDQPADLIDSGDPPGWPPPGLMILAIVIAMCLAMVGDASAHRFELPVTPTNQGRQVTPDALTPVPVPGAPAVGFPPPALDLPGVLAHFDLGSTGYAVVTAEDCDRAADCRVSLATNDGLGRWWQGTVPRDDTPAGRAPRPLVLGNGVLVLVDYGLQTPGGWYSDDGGRAWRPVPTLRHLILRHAAGSRLDLKRTGLPTADPCAGQQVAGYLRSSGQLVPLRGQPELRPCSVVPFPDLSGRRWVAGTTSTGAAVAVSTDDGRTWSRSVLPGTGHARYVEVTLTERHAYAVVFGHLAELARPTVTGVFRHTNRGWSPIWRPVDAVAPSIGKVTVCPEGLLLSPLPVTAWSHLGRGGTGPDRAVASGALPAVAATAVPGYGWYGWYFEAESARPVYSRDCRSWRGLTVI